ncbi:MAG: hypothetical protein WCF16_11225, partial [Alphaproteobacteria bacterium]
MTGHRPENSSARDSARGKARDLVMAAAPGDVAAAMRAVDAADAAGLAAQLTANVVVLRNFTLETIEPFLKLHLYRAGLGPAVRFGGYDTIRQDVIGPDSILSAAPVPDVVVLALVLDRLDPGHLRPGWTADHAMGEVKALLGSLAERTEALVAVNTVLAPWYEAGIGIQSAGDYA